MKAYWTPYRLNFNFTAITSRSSMTVKDTYFIRIEHDGRVSYGECPLFRGLSADDLPDYEAQLAAACAHPEAAISHPYSSIRFGFESALAATPDTAWIRGERGIPINGLIWMADRDTMARRIAAKLDEGYKILKLKIGGIRFDDELELLAHIRRKFPPEVLEVRLDANGSFTPDNASARLERLARYGVHSIEQPIKAGQTEAMAALCESSPIPIALDEELIGTRSAAEARALVEAINPAYLILKPALCGGFAGADTYINIAQELGIGWWATSALESNLGLYAIGRWLSGYDTAMPQGLGTGQLYTNNIASPLSLRECALHFDCGGAWGDMERLPWRE
ncbi:MAG: o-succinylbenzoate synthase [Muribaculaceae bacterium]|nr:o-succinylbenzoate synthase [Muribaculaceae bacterium]